MLFFGLTAGMVLTEALAAPDAVVHFAATHVAEITMGTCSCLVVSSRFSSESINKGQGASAALWFGGVRDVLNEELLRKHWPLLEHSTRGALAVALLPLVWRWFGIRDFAQTAVTSYIVMIVA